MQARGGLRVRYLCSVRVLYVSYDGLTDPLGQSQILPYLMGLRKRLGSRFQPDILSFEKLDAHVRLAPVLRARLQEQRIGWFPQRFHERPRFLAKVYDQLHFIRTAHRLLREARYEILHARSYVSGWVAHRLSQRYRTPWIFDMRGFWADERRENDQWPSSNPFYRWLYDTWKKREARMLHSAAEVIVLSETARQVLHAWGLPPEKITVIPCAADYTLFSMDEVARHKAREQVRHQLNIPAEVLLLVYSGSVARHYAPEAILHIFAHLHKLEPKAYLLILSPHSTDHLHQQMHLMGLPAAHLRVTTATRPEIPAYLAAADAGIATVIPTFAKTASSFTKLAEYLAADLPVIATAIGDVEALSEALPAIFPYRHLSDIPAAVERLWHFLKKGKAELATPLSLLSRPLLGVEMALDRYQAVYERLYEGSKRRRMLTA